MQERLFEPTLQALLDQQKEQETPIESTLKLSVTLTLVESDTIEANRALVPAQENCVIPEPPLVKRTLILP